MRDSQWRTKLTSPAALLGVLLWAASALAQACLAQDTSREKRFEFQIAGGRLAAGESTVRVSKGDTVVLSWTSDRPLELHLHGYDLQVRAMPGVPQALRFEARATGRFPVEIHGSSGKHITLIYVEVHPR